MSIDQPPTIAVLTALPIECYAVQQVLDGLSETEAPDPYDRSSYWLGTMPSSDSRRPHRVVLTTLVEDGGISAANACANIGRSWAVTEIIMSGIACGVPAPEDPTRHVRLGDILVADEGVVPYGHLRVFSEHEELRRHAAKPSVNLKRAASRLRVLAERGEAPWNQVLNTVLHSTPAAYHRPPSSSDALFPHPTQPQRRPFAPMVHYGLIGSGGKLLRSDRERNRLASKYYLIGFEMEGDGVSDSTYLQGINWFMVRGVSDYGDSRKNEQWQRYAALASAAYVRALVAQLAPLAVPARPVPSVRQRAAGRPVPPSLPDRFAAVLLTLPDVVNIRYRDAIVANLPGDVRQFVPRSRAARADVMGWIQTMAGHPEGLATIVEAVAKTTGDPGVVQRLRELLTREAN